ncbi:MAG: peptide MFS transporter [Bacteroidetes bacterium]|nr:peptide MFS transporter [Bacteroidota bacterium]
MAEVVEEKLKQPAGLWLLSFTSIWERFSYYGMRAFLILYMANDILNPLNKKSHLGGLSLDKSDAGFIYGTFTSMCYLLPLLGGYLSDRFFGKRKSVVIGGVFIMIGHFTLAMDINFTSFIIGLVLLAFGNGFFKPSAPSMIGDLYTPGDKRRDSGFTWYYMLFNGGAFFAPLICGYFGEEYGFRYGFMIAGFAMMLGLIIYMAAANRFLGEIGKYPVHKQKSNADMDKRPLTKIEKDRIWVIVVLWFFVTFFWTGFEQAGTTLTLYTDDFIDKSIFGWIMPTSWFQAINPVFIVLLGSVFASLWVALAKIKKNPSTPVKMGLGMIALAIGFVFMVGAVLERGGDVKDIAIKASLIWIVITYLFHTIGELCLSPIGLSMVTKLAPARYASLFMGIWFTSSAVANFLSGAFVSFTEKLGAMNIFAGIAIFIAILGIIVIILSKWLVKMMHGAD